MDFQARQIKDGSALQKKICPDNAIDGKTVVHRSYFDCKVAHLQFTHGQTIDALDEDKLCATDTPNALHWIIRFVLQANCHDLISGKERARRACI